MWPVARDRQRVETLFTWMSTQWRLARIFDTQGRGHKTSVMGVSELGAGLGHVAVADGCDTMGFSLGK